MVAWRPLPYPCMRGSPINCRRHFGGNVAPRTSLRLSINTAPWLAQTIGVQAEQSTRERSLRRFAVSGGDRNGTRKEPATLALLLPRRVMWTRDRRAGRALSAAKRAVSFVQSVRGPLRQVAGAGAGQAPHVLRRIHAQRNRRPGMAELGPDAASGV